MSMRIIDEEMIVLMDFVEEFEPTFPRFRRRVQDMDNPLERYTDVEFMMRFRFSKTTVCDALKRLLDCREGRDGRGLSVPPLLQLCCTLRFFATANFQIVCGDLGTLHQSTVCRIINRTAKSIALHLPQYVRFPATASGMNAIFSKDFRISRSDRSYGGDRAEIFRNRKGWMSINVQVVSGPNMNIQDIDIKWPGSTHDSRIIDSSAVKLRLDERQIDGILLGDAGYMHSTYMFTPVLDPQTDPEKRYNKAHKQTRCEIERLFGIWKRRFPCLSRKHAPCIHHYTFSVMRKRLR